MQVNSYKKYAFASAFVLMVAGFASIGGHDANAATKCGAYKTGYKCTTTIEVPKTCYKENYIPAKMTCSENASHSADFSSGCSYSEARTEEVPYDCSTSKTSESCYVIRTESYGEQSDTYRETKVNVDCSTMGVYDDGCGTKGNSQCGGGGDSH